MTGRKKAGDAVAGAAQGETAGQAPPPDRNKLTDRQLAKAILAKALRPRVGEVRRVAEAVLRKDAPKAAKKKSKAKKAKSGKLAKIPRSRK